MGRRISWKMSLIVLLIPVIFLAGCREKAVSGNNLTGNEYQIYYLNTGMTRMVPVSYEAEAADRSELIQELYDQLVTVPAELDAKSPLIAKAELQHFQWEQNVLYLYFDTNYTMMSSSQEILCRAALTKTLTQIEGVDYLNIYSGEQPLMDSSGTPVGMLSATDFMDNISDVNAFERSELVLYFADESGGMLTEEKREVIHNINTSMERLIVEQLLEGPEREGLKATVPPETKILNVTVTDNVCYLNFDSAFLNNNLEIADEIPIYSIVDSLTQLTTVNRVQFSVNGSSAVMFRDRISLDTLFEQNMDYVTGGESS